MENKITPELKREGNKIIGLFMGFHDGFGRDANNIHVKLRYHSSWDWLIKVIEKIKDSYQGEDNHIESCKLYDHIEANLKELNIEWVWQSVVKFIKWHNSLTPPKEDK